MLKTRLASLGNGYKSDNPDDIVEEYSAFLNACAHHTQRLNKSLVARAAAKLWGVPASVADSFGSAMQKAMSHCYAKHAKATTGVRMSPVVKSTLSGDAFRAQKRPQLPIDEPPMKKHAALLDVDTPEAIAEIYGCKSAPSRETKPLVDKRDALNSEPVVVDTSGVNAERGTSCCPSEAVAQEATDALCGFA